MGLERLEPEKVSAEALTVLGLSNSTALNSTEALAASLRRAASFLCPTTSRALLAAVSEALSGLPELSAGERKAKLVTLLDSLVAHGDLIELPLDEIGGSQRHLFLGPPSFIRRDGGFLLIGVRPDGAPILDRELLARVEHKGHAQLIKTDQPKATEDLLATEGLLELSQEQWLSTPRRQSAGDLVSGYRERLAAAGPAGEIQGVEVIDTKSDVRFYRGRWRSNGPRDEGQFLIRRPQRFGARLWSFAEISRGVVQRLVDLPVESVLTSGADEGWRLQAALDQLFDDPQIVRVGPSKPGTSVLDLFAPLPSWAQRRLDLIGEPTSPSAGALFSYLVDEGDVDEEIRFLEQMLFVAWERVGGEKDGD